MASAARAPMQLPRWQDVYREAELYKSAVRVHTKPLFQWRKALDTSTDGGTLCDFAARGLRGLDAVHTTLASKRFEFCPSAGLKYNLSGKRRTLYIPPWEERSVDLLLSARGIILAAGPCRPNRDSRFRATAFQISPKSKHNFRRRLQGHSLRDENAKCWRIT